MLELLITISYIINAPIGFGQSLTVANIGAAIVTVAITVIFFNAAKKARANNVQLDEDVSNWNRVA